MHKYSLVITATLFTALASYSLISHDSNLIPLTVLFNNPEKASPQISPDGSQLAYLAPVNGILNVWIKTPGKHDDKPITHAQRPIHDYWWAYNNQQILYYQDTNGDENYHLYAVDLKNYDTRDLTPFAKTKAEAIAIDKHFPNEIVIIMNKDNPKLFDAYRLNTITGELMLLAKNPDDVVWWAADRSLNVKAAISSKVNGRQILLIRQSDDSWKPLLEVGFEDTLKDELYNGLLGFSKDGNHLYLNSSWGHNTRSLIRLDIKTGLQEVLATDPTYDLQSVLFNSDTYEPEIVTWDKERLENKVLTFELQADFDAIRAINNGDLESICRSADDMHWILGFDHDNKSFEYYWYDRTTHKATFLFVTRPALNNYQLAPMYPIALTARDGLPLHGYITYPLGKERRNLPIILHVHGGPFSRDTWGYFSTIQFLANRGYAVLQVNFRGSSGYGKEFLAAGNREWGGKMHNDLIDTVNWAIETGIADPEKIALFGASYGGYAALVGATFTPDVFHCAIDYVGISNLVTVLKSIPPYWNIEQWEQRIGSLKDEEFLKSRSPLYKVDNIKIPMLIAHGANDVRVTQLESEQIVAAMKAKNIPYEYLLFPDEGHGFIKPENRLAFYRAVEKFLARHMGGRQEPIIC